MNDVNDAATGELDLDDLADFWMGGQTVEEQSTAVDPAIEGEVANSEEENAEGAESSPTPAQIIITPEMRAQIAREEISNLAARAQEEKARRDLQALLDNGSDEDVAKHFREQLAVSAEQAKLDEVIAQRTGDYAEGLIRPFFQDEAFMGSLTPEDLTRINPETFQGSDADYYQLLVNVKAEKARVGLFDEAEVERRVQERLTAQQNEARGVAFSGSSATQLPTSAEASRHDGKTGRDLDDSLWEEVVEGWANTEKT